MSGVADCLLGFAAAHGLAILDVGSWLFGIGCVLPAVWRLVTRRHARYLDPIWALAFLGSVNRIGMLAAISSTLSHALAIGVAVTMGGFALWYQRRDA